MQLKCFTCSVFLLFYGLCLACRPKPSSTQQPVPQSPTTPLDARLRMWQTGDCSCSCCNNFCCCCLPAVWQNFCHLIAFCWAAFLCRAEFVALHHEVRWCNTHTQTQTSGRCRKTHPHTHTNNIGLRILQNFYIRICLGIQTDAIVCVCAFM